MAAAKPSIALLYGFCEGPFVARRFRRQLMAAGFVVTDDAETADIILGHSGGCFLLPESFRATRIIQVGIPFWPGRPLISSIGHKFISDLRHHHHKGALGFWVKKFFWNTIYIWNLPANVRMARGRAQGKLWRYGRQTIVVRPTFDTFCTPQLDDLPFTHTPTFITVPGHHDDIWRNPKPYIVIVQS